MTKTETKNLWKSLMAVCAKKDHPHVAMLDYPYYDVTEKAIVATNGHTLIILDASLFKANFTESGYVDLVDGSLVQLDYKKGVEFPNWIRIRDREAYKTKQTYENISINEHEGFTVGYWLARKDIFLNPKYLDNMLTGRYTVEVSKDSDNPYSCGTVTFTTTIGKTECKYIIAGRQADSAYFEN